MNRKKFKLIAILVLFFYSWTFTGLFNTAYAFKNNQESLPGQQPKQRPEDKLQQAIEDIGKALTDASADTVTKKTRLMSKKADLESLDTDIRKQFADTEKKLKEAGLPPEILQRHHAFVKHYEDNLNELKANLEAVGKAKTDAAVDAAVEKVRSQLEKVRPPKKHKRLDPHKLPHRTPEVKKREPRLKQEEFQPPVIPVIRGTGYEGKTVGWAAPTDLQYPSSLVTRHSSPLLVASNGPLSGLVSKLPSSTSDSPIYPFTNSPLILALNTTDLPTAADLAQTIEVQFTPDIQAKAQELGYNPVKIYEWVRNNIEYVPIYGSIQGADMCLQTKQCNDMDTASLLIALLRSSNISARYVYGTIELPIEKVKNWVGGFTNANAAIEYIASGGTSVKEMISGGKMSAVQMEHIWVETYVDYIPSRGAVHKQGDTWIPLDASYKQYTYNPGMDLFSSISFNGEQFMNEYIADLQEIMPYQHYGQETMSWLDINMPDATIEEILGAEDIPSTKVIVSQTFPYLLGTLPYKVVVKGAKYADLPDNLRHKVTFQIQGDFFGESELSLAKTFPELSRKRVTLSYIPATANDEAIVAMYGGDMLSVPGYMLKVKPVIKIDGIDTAIGGSVGMAIEQTLMVTVNSPSMGADVAQHNIIAGQYSAITVRSGNTPVDIVGTRMGLLINNSKNVDIVSLDDLLGELLSNIGLAYFHHLTFENDLYAKNFQMIYQKPTSEAMTTLSIQVSYLFGVPRSVSQGGMNIDADINTYVAASLNGDANKEKDFLNIAGMSSSAWEHRIFETFFNTPSVSAMKLLKYANQTGVPIYTIDNTNISQLLPTLQLSADVETDVQNAVNAGKKVITHQSELQYYDWQGAGYAILDPVTGAGAYMISGGLAGGGTSQMSLLKLRQKPTYVEKNINPLMRYLVVMNATGFQGTFYLFGGKDPTTGYVDCSGLVAYVFAGIGIRDLMGKNAQGQYDYIVSHGGTTTNPLSGDLIFFHDTYDKNRDGNKTNDGVTHVGIYTVGIQYIAAQGKIVDFYDLYDFLTRDGKRGIDLLKGYGIVIP